MTRAIWLPALALGALGAALAASSGAQPTAAGLRTPADFAGITDTRARSQALFSEMGKVLQHPRCVNCHPRTDRPLRKQGVPHSPPVERGIDGLGAAGMRCDTCHGPANVAFVGGGSIPGNPAWHLAPREMAWEGKTLGQICAQLKDAKRNGGRTLAQIHEHNATDSLVGWGWDPGAGREPAPGSQKLFGELTQAWIDSGAVCPKG